MDACTGFLGAGGLLYGQILPLAGIVAVLATIVFVLVYLIANMLQNPKLLVWVKTEVVQVVVSFSALIIILAAMNSFCSIDANSVRDLLGQPHGTATGNIFNEAESYLVQSTDYAHYTMGVTRYYLSAYSIFTYRSDFTCDLYGLGCLFGGSGKTSSPLANYGGKFGTLNFLFGTTLLYFMTSANMLLILLFSYKGFVLFFMPAAIIIRSTPYLRSLGSVMLAVCLAFFLIYPLSLAVFSLASNGLFDKCILKTGDGVTCWAADETKFYEESGWGYGYGSVLGSLGNSRYTNDGMLKEDFFPGPGGQDDFVGVLQIISRAFVGSFLLPSLALAAAITSVRYFGRLYGEDIDLSKLSQLV